VLELGLLAGQVGLLDGGALLLGQGSACWRTNRAIAHRATISGAIARENELLP
jgi:hypothetical protein